MHSPIRANAHPMRGLMPAAVAVVLLCLVLTALGSSRREPLAPVQGGIGALLARAAGAGAALHDGATMFWLGTMRSSELAAENEMLRREMAELRLQQAMAAAKGEVTQARAALSPVLPTDTRMVDAAVLGHSPAAGRRLLWIAAGTDKGVEAGMVVVGALGVVGSVERAFDTTALVVMLDDSRSRWGAVAGVTGENGVLTGTGSEGEIELVLERATTAMQPGEALVTTGQAGSAAPGGLPFGTIRAVERNKSGELVARVDLAEDPAKARLVFVLLERRLPWAPPEARR